MPADRVVSEEVLAHIGEAIESGKKFDEYLVEVLFDEVMRLRRVVADLVRAELSSIEASLDEPSTEISSSAPPAVDPQGQSDLETATGLLGDLVDLDGVCRTDHHGHCQEHGWLTASIRCPHARARDFLRRRTTLVGFIVKRGRR